MTKKKLVEKSGVLHPNQGIWVITNYKTHWPWVPLGCIEKEIMFVVFLPKTAKSTSKHKDTIREICWGLHWPPFFQNNSFVKDKGLELPQLKGDQKDRTTGSWIEFWVSKKKKRERERSYKVITLQKRGRVGDSPPKVREIRGLHRM